MLSAPNRPGSSFRWRTMYCHRNREYSVESSQQQHEKVGHKCSESELDAVYTIGDESIITNSVLQNVPVQAHFRIPDELITTLSNDLHNGDKVLFKGSRGMAMERIIEGVFLN